VGIALLRTKRSKETLQTKGCVYDWELECDWPHIEAAYTRGEKEEGEKLHDIRKGRGLVRV
jgi:hypothetical protein